MTLYKQIFTFLLALLVGLFIVTLSVNFNSSRTFLAAQLESHAQDTATSLGVSLSMYVRNADVAAMDAVVNAVFDRGYYREIRVATNDGTALVERSLPVVIEDVPQWFIRWIPLDTPRVSARIMAGWNPVGDVFVRSHPGYAYVELWRTTTRTLLWFAAVGLLAVSLAAILLNSILKPLRAVEHQAQSIYGGQYVMQDELPKARELKRVVLAMNRMTEKVRDTFEEQSRTTEQLRDQAFFDSVTGLANRRAFENFLQTQLKSPRAPQYGAMMLVQLRVLSGINEKEGSERGDDFLRAVAGLLTDSVFVGDDAIVARLSGAGFGLLLPAADLQETGKAAAQICAKLAHLYADHFGEETNVANVGISRYAHGQAAADVMTRADAALRSAQTAESNSWRCSDDAQASPPEMDRVAWRERLTDVIAGRDIQLYLQPVMDISKPNRVLHAEVLARIRGDDDRLWRAGDFMPIAGRIGLAEDLDRIILAEGLARLSRIDDPPAWAINVSLISLTKDAFLTWLLDLLSGVSNSGTRIILECAEPGVALETERLQELAQQLRSLGHGLAIDHFGQSCHPFGYLQSLRPDYVKIDGTYTHSISGDRDKQFVVASLSKVAHSLDIKAIAEAVESREEWDALERLHVDGIQGFAAGRPRPVEAWGRPAAQ